MNARPAAASCTPRCALVYLQLSLAIAYAACSGARKQPPEAAAPPPASSAHPDAGSSPRVQEAAATAPPPAGSKPRRIEFPPLALAAHLGELAHVRKLLNEGANVNARDSSGGTALMSAVFPVIDEPPDIPVPRRVRQQRWQRKLQIARLLIEQGAAVNVRDDEVGWTALHCAISAGGNEDDVVALLELMIARGADVDAKSKDPYQRTPLEEAINVGKPKRVACLLRHGADPHAPVHEGGSLLQLARARRNAEVIALMDEAAKQPDR